MPIHVFASETTKRKQEDNTSTQISATDRRWLQKLYNQLKEDADMFEGMVTDTWDIDYDAILAYDDLLQDDIAIRHKLSLKIKIYYDNTYSGITMPIKNHNSRQLFINKVRMIKFDDYTCQQITDVLSNFANELKEKFNLKD